MAEDAPGMDSQTDVKVLEKQPKSPSADSAAGKPRPSSTNVGNDAACSSRPVSQRNSVKENAESAFDPSNEVLEPQKFDEDVFLFRGIGKRIMARMRELGDSFNLQSFFGAQRKGEQKEFEMEQIPAEHFEDVTRFVQSAFRVPFYGVGRTVDGRKAVPVVLSLIKVAITDSDDVNVNYGPSTTFKIKLSYGEELHWDINRRILDFVRLHTILSFRHIQRHLDPRLPKFPNQLSFMVDMSIFKTLNKDERNELRHRMVLDRRKALEKYLTDLLFIMNMQANTTELFEFLEISHLSLSLAEPGSKAKEGYLKNRIFETKPQKSWIAALCFCIPRRKRYQTKWFLIRSSYIAYVDFIDQATPSDILLCDRSFRIVTENEFSSNPLKPFSVTIYNCAKKLEVRPESNSQMRYWLQDLRRLTEESIWCHSQRFGSFCPIRANVCMSWLIDAEECYTELARVIQSAKEEIYLHGWWISPELYLVRPAALHPQFRLDRLLQSKAREGVKVYIVIFKEISMALSINSLHTKVSLGRLHQNIKVQRHPDHLGGGVLYWAHHEKLVVVDQKVAFVGGLDLCYGRYDTSSHPLTDYHPSNQSKAIWNGMDYANPRIRDFRNVVQFSTSLVDRKQVPRMPWHDVHSMVYGQPARDIARHFIQRWNFIKQEKAMHKELHIPFLLPKPDYRGDELQELNFQGTCRVQMLRSSSEWSMGTAPEASIYDAYVHYIKESIHFLFIENQFFISKSTDSHLSPIRNGIASAILERIVRAYEERAEFRVIVFLPLLPAFEAAVNSSGASSVRMIMQSQYASISKGPFSLIGQLLQRGIKPEQYISFFALRKYDILDGKHVTEQVYIHSKVLVVDDRVAIIGSANMNDRSMLGTRDSEIAMVLEDADHVESRMNGQPFTVGRKVQELRRRLMQEHLGLLGLPCSHPDVQVLDDPVLSSFYFGVLRYQASLNTQIYRELFHCVPDDCVDTWDEYRRFTGSHRVQTLDPELGLNRMDSLKTIRGSIVLYPTQFLKKEDLSASMLSPEILLPVEVYL